ncbi:MAG: 1,4-alpha-glucan branching protein domain-containing protein [Chitinophagales bacterium]
MKARLILVLHSHIPYVMRQGRWPFGEVWLFEAMAETYIPFIRSWARLLQEGYRVPLTISMSPTLLEQLASPYIQEGFIKYLKEREDMATTEEKHFLASGQKELASLANFYRCFYRDVRRDYVLDFDCDIIKIIKSFKDRVPLEVIATAGTHAYLPLLKDHDSLERQITRGIETFTKQLGTPPAGFWLPECGYYQGLEDILARCGIRYFFVDSHAIEGGKPPQVYSEMEELVDDQVDDFAETGLSTFRGYRIKDKDIAVFGRNAMISHQVWSKHWGYPGDAAYREFHKTSEKSGFKYWKVTDRKSDMGTKTFYDADEARIKAKEHAAHFNRVLTNSAREAIKLGFRSPLIVGCYDTELFGHWWWEGVDWIEEVMRLIAHNEELEQVLPSTILQSWDKMPEAQVFESSWGMGGKHFGWHNNETNWMWETIKLAREEYKSIQGSCENELVIEAASQAEKELMLMESSDWFFMVTNNHTQDYAVTRFFDHYARLVRLTDMVKRNQFSPEDITWMRDIEKEDQLFT